MKRLLGHSWHCLAAGLAVASLSPDGYFDIASAGGHQFPLFAASGADEESNVVVARVAIGGDPQFLDCFAGVGRAVVGIGFGAFGVGEGAESGDEGGQRFLDSAFVGAVAGGCVGGLLYRMDGEDAVLEWLLRNKITSQVTPR